MRLTASDALGWVVACAAAMTAGCPQLNSDEFGRTAAAGASGASGGQNAGAAGAEPCPAGSGGSSGASGERCGEPAPDILLSADSGPASAADASDACAAVGGVRGPSGCFIVDAAETTWSDARARCQRLGAGWDLATLRDAEDNQFVATLAGIEAWVGATDQTREGTWVWAPDDTAFFVVGGSDASAGFTNWSPDEPNDLDDSDCLRVLATGLWADWDCDGVKGRVCQASAL